MAKEDHDVRDDEDGANERRWQFHTTAPGIKPSHRAAVAIDCEMGTAFDGDSELIRLTLVDYFTGQPLIDSLVYPDIPMMHYNTRWSGITRGDMERARRNHKCIFGKPAARRAIFRYVGPSTIVIGHGAQSDLLSLRWIHHRVVDSLLIESSRRKEAELKAEEQKKKREEEEAKEGKLEEGGEPNEPEEDGELSDKGGAKLNEETKGKETDKPSEGAKPTQRVPGNKQPRRKNNPDGMSLKALTMKHLGRAIQVGKKGHDSLEDALAARDLVNAFIRDLSIPTAAVAVSASGTAG
jgi:RNA exonuclease 1